MIHTSQIKPAPGLKIRFPDRPQEVLPKNGAKVPASSFWMRRLKDGSVLRVEQTAKKGGK